jgi:hypothetical protein
MGISYTNHTLGDRVRGFRSLNGLGMFRLFSGLLNLGLIRLLGLTK